MKHYPFLTIAATEETLTYSSLKNNSVEIYIEKPNNDDFSSISIQLSISKTRITNHNGYTKEEISAWEDKIIKLKNIIFELAEEKAKEETAYA